MTKFGTIYGLPVIEDTGPEDTPEGNHFECGRCGQSFERIVNHCQCGRHSKVQWRKCWFCKKPITFVAPLRVNA